MYAETLDELEKSPVYWSLDEGERRKLFWETTMHDPSWKRLDPEQQAKRVGQMGVSLKYVPVEKTEAGARAAEQYLKTHPEKKAPEPPSLRAPRPGDVGEPPILRAPTK